MSEVKLLINYLLKSDQIESIKSSMGGRSGVLYQKGLPLEFFKPMSDSCHSFLSCDPGQENGPMRVGVKGHSRWRLMVGVCFFVGQPLTRREKGSRAQDGG